MTGPLAYDPSVEALVRELSRFRLAVSATPAALRARVSRPVIARAGGIGEIHGGEIVIAPPGRGDVLVARIDELEAGGIAGLILADPETVLPSAVRSIAVIVAHDAEPRSLRDEIELFIVRRRRELFALDRQLHRMLVESALGGAPVNQLLCTALEHTRRPVLLDRDGDVVIRPREAALPPPQTLVDARTAARDRRQTPVRVTGAVTLVMAPVVAGRERLGLVALVGPDACTPDEDEALASALASACAIALSRIPAKPVPAVSEILEQLASPVPSGAAGVGEVRRVTAAAFRAESASLHSLERAVAAEMRLRAIAAICGADGNTLVAIAETGDDAAWEAIRAGVAGRLGAPDTAMGLGGERHGTSSADISVRESVRALQLAPDGEVTRYTDVQVTSLLASDAGWDVFARSRLAPLHGDSPASRDLILTLRTYLSAGRNAKEAAARMHVHRNTLQYRLRRIEELLGVDLSNPNTLFELELALRVMDGPAYRSRR